MQLFQQAALAFLVRAVEYGINNLPLKEVLLKHAKFVDVQQRAECVVKDALYFVDRQGFTHFQRFQHIEYFVKFNFDQFLTGLSQFGGLSKIAALVLVLPHLNADAERVFSMVGLNKTKTRNSLALDGTLSSIMTVKMAGLEPQYLKWEPLTLVLKASKPAINTYNKQH